MTPFPIICELNEQHTSITNMSAIFIILSSDAIRFSFGPLVQQELDKVVTEWNHHHIRSSSTSEVPAGVPELLYNLPELEGMGIKLPGLDSVK